MKHKPTSDQKLEKVKSFAEAGRKMFGGPGSGPQKGGGSGNSDTGDKTVTERNPDIKALKEELLKNNLSGNERTELGSGTWHRARTILEENNLSKNEIRDWLDVYDKDSVTRLDGTVIHR